MWKSLLTVTVENTTSTTDFFLSVHRNYMAFLQTLLNILDAILEVVKYIIYCH